jgi:hypothetical protein
MLSKLLQLLKNIKIVEIVKIVKNFSYWNLKTLPFKIQKENDEI